MQNLESQPEKQEIRPYEPPQIIYESRVTTRAGSPLSNLGSVDDIDPADLFGK